MKSAYLLWRVIPVFHQVIELESEEPRRHLKDALPVDSRSRTSLGGLALFAAELRSFLRILEELPFFRLEHARHPANWSTPWLDGPDHTSEHVTQAVLTELQSLIDKTSLSDFENCAQTDPCFLQPTS